MANRFARRIRDGDIDTPEALKAEFKALAKSTHPDLAGPDGAAEFIRVREEYESALRDFERHRFGVRAEPGARARPAGIDPVTLAFASLGLLRKRGFPKEPRHEKEALRYEYARWSCVRALESLSEGCSAYFQAYERGMLELKRTDEAVAAEALGYLDALIEYAALRLPALRTALLVDLGSLRSNPRVSVPAMRFLSELSACLGIGSALPTG